MCGQDPRALEQLHAKEQKKTKKIPPISAERGIRAIDDLHAGFSIQLGEFLHFLQHPDDV